MQILELADIALQHRENSLMILLYIFTSDLFGRVFSALGSGSSKPSTKRQQEMGKPLSI